MQQNRVWGNEVDLMLNPGIQYFALYNTVDAGYKNTGYKNISDIRTIFLVTDFIPIVLY